MATTGYSIQNQGLIQPDQGQPYIPQQPYQGQGYAPQGQPQGYQVQQPYQGPTYAYDQSWQPPPTVGSDDPNAKVDYNYDPIKTPVSYITVEQWNQIENDRSPYSQYWAKGEFTPEKFSANQNREFDCLDKGWMIAFWINFLISLVFMIVIATVRIEKKESSSTTQIIALASKAATEYGDSTQSFELTMTDEQLDNEVKVSLLKAVGVGIGVGLGLTILHFFYMSFFPHFYIKFGLWLEVILICGFLCLPLFITNQKEVGYACVGMAVFVFLVFLCVFCCCLKDFIEFTCMVFEKTTTIEKSHPAIFLVIFIQIIIELVANIIYSAAFIFIAVNNWSYFVYIYYVFSYYWVVATNYYVFYLISANLAANCYFLDGTQYFPQNPIWDSVKKSLSKTFGSAAFAGFIAAIMSTLEHICDQLMNSDNNVMKIIGCIVYCILCCLQAIFHHISRYGLFYVTVYNVPFLEGARRFTEISCKKFITTFMGESILDTALTFNSFIFGLLSICLGIFLGWTQFKNYMDAKNEVAAIITIIFYPVFIIMFTEVFLWCLFNPADTITYSLFICFTEFPERLKTVNTVQYEFFVYRYACATARATKHDLPPRPAGIDTK